MKLIPVFSLILGTCIFHACNQKIVNNMNIDNIDLIEYRFRDSSTPPQYHRSYLIRATEEKVEFKIDVYGTILVDTVFGIEASRFQQLKSKAEMLDPPGEKITEAATGTKSYRISLLEKGKENYQLYWDSLQSVGKETDDFKEEIKSLIPEMGQLLSTPMKNRK